MPRIGWDDLWHSYQANQQATIQALTAWETRGLNTLVPVVNLPPKWQIQGCRVHNQFLTGRRPSKKLTLPTITTSSELRYEVGVAFLRNPQPSIIGNECSHTCGNKYCIRREHLHYEPQAVNRGRDGCAGTHIYLDAVTGSMNVIRSCVHQPECTTLFVAHHVDVYSPGNVVTSSAVNTGLNILAPAIQLILPPDNRQ